VTGTGAIGLSTGAVANVAPPSPGAPVTREVSEPTVGQSTKDIQTCKSFAPFEPGLAMITVTMEQSRSLKLSETDYDTLEDAAATLSDCDLDGYKASGLATLSKARYAGTDADLGQLIHEAKRLNEVGAGGKCKDATTQAEWTEAVTSFTETLSLVKSEMTNTKRSETFGVIVEREYLGAVRVGVAATYGAPDAAWEARNLPGDTESGPVVTQTEGGQIATEFVLSYTQFFAPSSERASDVRLGGTFGLGIADLKTAEIGLQSVYLGLDIGFLQASITPVVALRHVNTLTGIKEGDAIGTTAEIPLEAAWTPSVGVLVHVPFDLLRSALEGQATKD
jgi:hypothetical protein